MSRMKKPYKLASIIPFFLDPDFLVKNETVKGIIGNKQGVSRATRPPRKPIKKILNKLLVDCPSTPVPPQVDNGLSNSMVLLFSPPCEADFSASAADF